MATVVVASVPAATLLLGPVPPAWAHDVVRTTDPTRPPAWGG